MLLKGRTRDATSITVRFHDTWDPIQPARPDHYPSDKLDTSHHLSEKVIDLPICACPQSDVCN